MASRDYLKSVDLESILQQLVRDALDNKPEDALAFAAEWTRKKLHQRNSSGSMNSGNLNAIPATSSEPSTPIGGSATTGASASSPNNTNNASSGGGGLGGAAVTNTANNNVRTSPLSIQHSTGTTDSNDPKNGSSRGGEGHTPPVTGRSDSGLVGLMAKGSSENVLKTQQSVNIKAKGADSELDVNDANSVVLYSWRMRSQDEDEHFMLHFCDLVLNVLFSQHPSLQSRFLEEIGVPAETAAETLAIFVSQIIYRKSTPSQVAKSVMQKFNAFAPVGSAHRPLLLRLRQRHFHYLLCCILYAAECVFTRSTWKQIGADWLKVFGDVLQEIQNAVFDEQVVVASLESDKSVLDSEFEASILLTTCSLTRHSAIDIVKGIWLQMTATQQEKICRKFFAVLFTQHKTLIRIFVDEDKESSAGDSLVDQAPVKELQVILTQVLRGFLSLEGISSMAERHYAAIEGGIPQRYLHYCLSCMLTALSLELGPKKMDAQVSEAWRVFITRLLDAAGLGFEAVEKKRKEQNGEGEGEEDSTNDGSKKRKENEEMSCSRAGAENDRVSQSVDSGLKIRMDDPPKLESTNAGSAFSVAAECWSALRERQSAAEISETFFNILFTQHPMMAKTLVRSGAELSEAMAFLPTLFSEVCNCEVSESDLREMGAKLTGRGLDEQKADRAVAAAMSVFAILLGINVFREREEALQSVCRFITENILFGVQNSAAVLAARAPDIIVFESWQAIVDKESVVRKAMEVMKIQHRSLTRDLTDGVDIDVVVKSMAEFVTKALAPASCTSLDSGKLSDEEAKTFIGLLKAKCEEKQRPVDKKFVTYFAFSFQSAVGIILGSSRFDGVAHHWQSQMEKLTRQFSDMM